MVGLFALGSECWLVTQLTAEDGTAPAWIVVLFSLVGFATGVASTQLAINEIDRRRAARRQTPFRHRHYDHR